MKKAKVHVTEYGEIQITVQHARISIKPAYHPPLVWIESFRPRKGDYRIITQLTGTEDLASVFQRAAGELMAVIKNQREKHGVSKAVPG